jgi:hypothetical protein
MASGIPVACLLEHRIPDVLTIGLVFLTMFIVFWFTGGDEIVYEITSHMRKR